MKKLLLGVALALVGLAVVCVARALTLAPRRVDAPPIAKTPLHAEATSNLAKALRIATVSASGEPVAAEAFNELHQHFETAYPLTHQALSREKVNGHSLLFAWPGKDPSLPALLLLAHQDVVPPTPGPWPHHPFSGDVAQGFVWGRGALDDKGSLVATLEAVEQLLRESYTPQRTVLLAFGHDEEVGGDLGAKAMAALLESRGVRVELVVDEGLPVVEDMVPNVSGKVALVGIAEKGYLNVELTAEGPGGHSSVPPPHTTVGLVASTLHRLEERPLAPHLDGAGELFLSRVAPHMPFSQRVALANLWLFRPLVEQQLTRKAPTNALIRTTAAATVFEGSVKENVLPTKARAVVNFRVLPGQSTDEVLRHVQGLAPEGVKVAAVGARSEPSPTSPVDDAAYAALERTIAQVFPDAKVAPSLVLAMTDARHYTKLSSRTYRFMPLLARPEDLALIHGTGERLSVEVFADMVRFYRQLVLNTCGP